MATFALLQVRAAMDRAASDGAGATSAPPIVKGEPVPPIVGTTLDGGSFSLASLRGHPVIVNFWGSSCIPCRDEFPLFKTLLAEHAGEGLAIVGVLMNDAPAPARDFIARYGATWPTVDDPNGDIRTAYRVAGRPQSYFIDRDGVLRSIQVGELTRPEFDRQFALIVGGTAPGASSPPPAPYVSPSEAAAP